MSDPLSMLLGPLLVGLLVFLRIAMRGRRQFAIGSRQPTGGVNLDANDPSAKGSADHTLRHEFAEFLRHVVAEGERASDWERFMCRFYHDDLLETVRQQVGKLSFDRDGGKEWSPSEIERIQFWSRQLKTAD